jgi:hypothetical protein
MHDGCLTPDGSSVCQEQGAAAALGSALTGFSNEKRSPAVGHAVKAACIVAEYKVRQTATGAGLGDGRMRRSRAGYKQGREGMEE